MTNASPVRASSLLHLPGAQPACISSGDSAVAQAARQAAQCSLCSAPCQDAVSIACCGALFCELCLLDAMANRTPTDSAGAGAKSQTAHCPVCHRLHEVASGDAYYAVAPHIREIVAKLTVSCPTCGEAVPGSMLRRHLAEDCWEAEVCCPGRCVTREDLVVASGSGPLPGFPAGSRQATPSVDAVSNSANRGERATPAKRRAAGGRDQGSAAPGRETRSAPNAGGRSEMIARAGTAGGVSCNWTGLRKELSLHLSACEHGHRKQAELKFLRDLILCAVDVPVLPRDSRSLGTGSTKSKVSGRDGTSFFPCAVQNSGGADVSGLGGTSSKHSRSPGTIGQTAFPALAETEAVSARAGPPVREPPAAETLTLEILRRAITLSPDESRSLLNLLAESYPHVAADSRRLDQYESALSRAVPGDPKYVSTIRRCGWLRSYLVRQHVNVSCISVDWEPREGLLSPGVLGASASLRRIFSWKMVSDVGSFLRLPVVFAFGAGMGALVLDRCTQDRSGAWARILRASVVQGVRAVCESVLRKIDRTGDLHEALDVRSGAAGGGAARGGESGT